jgi:hypothetical protein
MLGELMAGAGIQYAAIEIGHQAAHFANELQAQIRQLRQDVNSLYSEPGEAEVTKGVTKKPALPETTSNRC